MSSEAGVGNWGACAVSGGEVSARRQPDPAWLLGLRVRPGPRRRAAVKDAGSFASPARQGHRCAARYARPRRAALDRRASLRWGAGKVGRTPNHPTTAIAGTSSSRRVGESTPPARSGGGYGGSGLTTTPAVQQSILDGLTRPPETAEGPFFRGKELAPSSHVSYNRLLGHSPVTHLDERARVDLRNPSAFSDCRLSGRSSLLPRGPEPGRVERVRTCTGQGVPGCLRGAVFGE